MVDLPNTMVDIPNTMVDLPNTMVNLPKTIVVAKKDFDSSSNSSFKWTETKNILFWKF